MLIDLNSCINEFSIKQSNRHFYQGVVFSIIETAVDKFFALNASFNKPYSRSARTQELARITELDNEYNEEMLSNLESILVSTVKDIIVNNPSNKDCYNMFTIGFEIHGNRRFAVLIDNGDYRIKEWEAGRGKPKAKLSTPSKIAKLEKPKRKVRVTQLPEELLNHIANLSLDKETQSEATQSAVELELGKYLQDKLDSNSTTGNWGAVMRVKEAAKPLHTGAGCPIEEAIANLNNFIFMEEDLDALVESHHDVVSTAVDKLIDHVLMMSEYNRKLSATDLTNILNARNYLPRKILAHHPNYNVTHFEEMRPDPGTMVSNLRKYGYINQDIRLDYLRDITDRMSGNTFRDEDIVKLNIYDNSLLRLHINEFKGHLLYKVSNNKSLSSGELSSIVNVRNYLDKDILAMHPHFNGNGFNLPMGWDDVTNTPVFKYVSLA